MEFWRGTGGCSGDRRAGFHFPINQRRREAAQKRGLPRAAADSLPPMTPTTTDTEIAAAIAETEASATDSLEAWAWLALLRQVLDLDNDASLGVH